MSDIRAIDFAKEVETNRQKLIQHCVANGKSVGNSDSLSAIVAVDTQIAEPIENGKFAISFLGEDGEAVSPTQYVTAGSSVTLPAGPTPEDSDYIEFAEWVTSGDTTNVQENIVCNAFYRTKYDSNLGQRPTYLFCYFDTGALSPTIGTYTHVSTYIDWGDGSAVEQITTSSKSHTYASAGLYVITVYGNSYSLGGNSSYGLFSANGYQNSLLKAYIGENYVSYGYDFSNSQSLRNVVLPSELTSMGSYTLNNCKSLKNVTLPKGLTGLPQATFSDCSSLRNVVLPKNMTSIGNQAFSNAASLNNIVIPSGLTSTGQQAFMNCYGLKSLILPSVFNPGANTFSTCSSLESIVIQNVSMQNFSMPNCYGLTEVVLPSGFDNAINLNASPLSYETLIDIAQKLKDNTGNSAKTITLSLYKVKTLTQSIYLDSNGDQVPYGTTGAVSLLEFIQNKNWTVAFS